MKMNNQNMYYPNYFNGYNNYYRNIYNTNPYTAFYHPYNQNLPNYINNNSDINNTTSYNETISNNNIDNLTLENEENKKEGYRLGPIGISKEKLSIFGFSIELDDLILIALILFLFFETDCDYSILIVLGLILFNISFSSLDLF